MNTAVYSFPSMVLNYYQSTMSKIGLVQSQSRKEHKPWLDNYYYSGRLDIE